jgi:hypothetical protein
VSLYEVFASIKLTASAASCWAEPLNPLMKLAKGEVSFSIKLASFQASGWAEP